MNRLRIALVASTALLLAVVRSDAGVEVADVFGPEMIVQRDVGVPVWGTADAGETVSNAETRPVFDAALGKTVVSPIVPRSNLATGNVVQGPAVIPEDETSIILTSSCQAIRQSDGCIDIQIERARA